MPPSRRRELPSGVAPGQRSETVVHDLSTDVGFASSLPNGDSTARLHGTKPRVVSAPLPITPSSLPLPTEIDPALTANAELLCEFSYRPHIKKYRLMRRSRIIDVFCIPREDSVTYLSSKPAPNVQVLLLPSLVGHSEVRCPGPKPRRLAERTDNASTGANAPEGAPGTPGTDAATVYPHLQTWRSFVTWPRRTKPPNMPRTDTLSDYARLGLTTVAPTLSPGVLDGTGVVFAPLALGEPRERWPTSIPLPELKRVVISFGPTKSLAPGPWVEHLLQLHDFNRPVCETVVLFRPGVVLDEGNLQEDGRGHWWLGELLATLFGGVPSHSLGAVTIAGLQKAAPGWPCEQEHATAQLKRVLSHFGPHLSPRRDWSDVEAARFLSLEAYEATVTLAEFELETSPV